MRFDIITIFPELFSGVLGCGILRRAQEAGLVEFQVVNLRDFATDKHNSVDDRPYGGGEGMVFLPGPLFAAIEHCTGKEKAPGTQVVLLTPQGRTWSQDMAFEFSTIPHTILICGRYEGVDQRVVDCLVDREISLGDFVLTGGEIPAMALLDSVVRLIPGALGNKDSTVNESFSTGLLDYPQYTRPHSFRGFTVPEVLLSGDHAKIKKWRREKALEKTIQNRPEMLKDR
jgi:tRNA (guanine37-N1)-methyltransferase